MATLKIPAENGPCPELIQKLCLDISAAFPGWKKCLRHYTDTAIKFSCLYPVPNGVHVPKMDKIHVSEIWGKTGKGCLSGRTKEEYVTGQLFLLSCTCGWKSSKNDFVGPLFDHWGVYQKIMAGIKLIWN